MEMSINNIIKVKEDIMKKGKKFLSLFLAAALAVTGISIGTPATANAASGDKNVTIQYRQVDASGDNAAPITGKEDKEIYITPDNDGKVTYNVPDEDKEFTATADDGQYKYTLIGVTDGKVIATAGEAGKYTIVLKYTRQSVKPDSTADDATQADIDALGAKITEAENALQDTTKDYTDENKATLQVAINTATAAKNGFTAGVSKKADVQAAINTLDAAITAFKATGITKNATADDGDIARLQDKITEAENALQDTEKDYTTIAKETLQAAINAAKTAKDGFTAGVSLKADVQEAIDTLDAAIEAFKAAGIAKNATADDGDIAKLQDKITEAEDALKDETKVYTDANKATLQAAINAAKTAKDGFTAGVSLKADVQEAIDTLDAAIKAFKATGEEKVPDATGDDADEAYMKNLTDKIADAQEALNAGTKKTQSAKDTLNAAIAEAQKVVDDFKAGKKVTKVTVDDAVKALDNAIKAFNASKDESPAVVTVNKTQLQAAILAAQSLKASDYTTASWTPFQTALNNAISVNNNQNATQAQVDAARTSLLGAQGALKKVVKSLTITDNLTGAKSSKTVKVAAGKKVTLKATVAPTDAANKSVTWSIDKKYAKYAKVSSKGVVTTTKKGAGKTVVVKATANDGSKISKTVKIQIMGKMVTSVKFKKAPKTAKIGKSFTLKTTIKSKGKGKLNKTLKWTSSNTKIATVNSKGKVTISKKAKKGQKVKITAAATDGSGKKATVTIKIKK